MQQRPEAAAEHLSHPETTAPTTASKASTSLPYKRFHNKDIWLFALNLQHISE